MHDRADYILTGHCLLKGSLLEKNSVCFVTLYSLEVDVSFQMGLIRKVCGCVSLAKWVKLLVISIQTFEVQAGAESQMNLECRFRNLEFSS